MKKQKSSSCSGCGCGLFILLAVAAFFFREQIFCFRIPVFASADGEEQVQKTRAKATKGESLVTDNPHFKPYVEPQPDALDEYAKNVPLEETKSIQTLAAYLMRRAKTEEERARALFIWMVYNIDYDSEVYWKNAKRGPEFYTAEGVLRNRKSVCSSYARLYDALGKAMGLETVYIDGDVKGTGKSALNPGLIEEHAWNGVKVNGLWSLNDCTWAAGHSDSSQQFVRKINLTWYEVAPEIMVFSHCAKNPKYQFLDKPVSLAEFRKLPHLKPWEFDFIPQSTKLLEEIRRQGKAELPKAVVHRPKVPIPVYAFPLDSVLQAGKTYRFELGSPHVLRAFLSHTSSNGEKNFYHLKHEKDRFVLEQAFPPGAVNFSYTLSEGKTGNSWAWIKYKVE